FSPSTRNVSRLPTVKDTSLKTGSAVYALASPSAVSTRSPGRGGSGKRTLILRRRGARSTGAGFAMRSRRESMTFGFLATVPLPTRQGAHPTRQCLVVEPDAGRDAARLGIRPVAAQHAEALLEAREASDGPVALHAVALLDPQSRRLQLLGQSGRLASAEQVVDRHL